jgi:hypothetical protein
LVVRVALLSALLPPAAALYIAALIASCTNNFATGASECTSNMNLFLWGGVVLSYLFLLGFVLLLVGPAVEHAATMQQIAVAAFVAGLGAVTALGAHELASPDVSSTCVRVALRCVREARVSAAAAAWILTRCIVAARDA